MNEILSIDGLSLSIETPRGRMTPLRQVKLSCYEGELLVILGESGAGKSLLAKAIMDILPDQVKITQGEIRRAHGTEAMSLVLQEPKRLLDPTLTVGRQIMEVLKFAGVERRERKERALMLLEEVSMDDARRRFHQHVHELSGGLAQRAVMAVALAKSPRILLADEPTTALDAISEKKILTLLMDLTKRKAMTTILITHSFSVARAVADRIVVMYAGRVIEVGRASEVLEDPIHPYTQGLVRAAALASDEEGNLASIPGNPPCPMHPPCGDPFSPRNPQALVMDFLEEPPLMKVTDTHYAATWLLDQRYKDSCRDLRRHSS